MCPTRKSLVHWNQTMSDLLSKRYTSVGYIARFQITVLVRSCSVWFWLVKVLLIVWPRSLLLCPFQKKLRIWWRKSFGFCQTDNPRFSCIMYCCRYRQLKGVLHPDTKISMFCLFSPSSRRKSILFMYGCDRCVWFKVKKHDIFPMDLRISHVERFKIFFSFST